MSKDDDDLPFGLYERLVTAGLKARLLRFDSATTRIVTEELDATEAHATLARHIANLRPVCCRLSLKKTGRLALCLNAWLEQSACDGQRREFLEQFRLEAGFEAPATRFRTRKVAAETE